MGTLAHQWHVLTSTPGTGLWCRHCGARMLFTQVSDRVEVQLVADRRGAVPDDVVELAVELLVTAGATEAMLEAAALEAQGSRRSITVPGMRLPEAFDAELSGVR